MTMITPDSINTFFVTTLKGMEIKNGRKGVSNTEHLLYECMVLHKNKVLKHFCAFKEAAMLVLVPLSVFQGEKHRDL